MSKTGLFCISSVDKSYLDGRIHNYKEGPTLDGSFPASTIILDEFRCTFRTTFEIFKACVYVIKCFYWKENFDVSLLGIFPSVAKFQVGYSCDQEDGEEKDKCKEANREQLRMTQTPPWMMMIEEANTPIFHH